MNILNCIKEGLLDIFNYYIIAFLPGGEAYTTTTGYYLGGVFMWSLFLSFFLPAFLIVAWRKMKKSLSDFSLAYSLGYVIKALIYLVKRRKLYSRKQYAAFYRNYMMREKCMMTQLAAERAERAYARKKLFSTVSSINFSTGKVGTEQHE